MTAGGGMSQPTEVGVLTGEELAVAGAAVTAYGVYSGVNYLVDHKQQIGDDLKKVGNVISRLWR